MLAAAVSNINPTIILPTPMVATTVADATAVIRVAPDNVAASFSILPTDNNASGSSTTVPSPAATAALSTTPAAPSTLGSSFLISDGANFWASPQAPFLAQMIGQDISPESGALLVQYEKLMAMAGVKYKPSDAMLPQPEPSGVFGRILKQETAQPTPAAMTEKASAMLSSGNLQPVREVPKATTRLGKVQSISTKPAAALSARAVAAYKQVLTRNATLPAYKEDSVEEIQAAA